MALSTREVVPGGLIHHSDRGVQYACGDYSGGWTRPASTEHEPAGCPWDNAMAESFMRTLKTRGSGRTALSRPGACPGPIGQFIEDIYNRQRLHSALDYLSPLVFETRLLPEPRLPLAASAAPATDTMTATVCV